MSDTPYFDAYERQRQLNSSNRNYTIIYDETCPIPTNSFSRASRVSYSDSSGNIQTTENNTPRFIISTPSRTSLVGDSSSNITVTNPGAGYTFIPSISFSSPTGIGTRAVAVREEPQYRLQKFYDTGIDPAGNTVSILKDVSLEMFDRYTREWRVV